MNTGAPANPTAYQKYLRDKPTYDKAYKTYLTEKAKANIAWGELDTVKKELYSNNQATWETTAYAGQVALMQAETDYQQASAWFIPEQATALGKDGLTLARYVQAWQTAQPLGGKIQSVQGATMLTANNGWQPQYAISTAAWVSTWNTWQGTTASIANQPGAPWTPAVSITLSTNTSASNFWDQFGYDSSSASGNVLVPEPWLFFGQGSWSSTTQKQDMYQKNNAVVKSVTLNTCVKPATFSIKPGSWSIGDPGTQFAQADETARQTLYPYVTAASVVYGISFTVNFDHSTYQNVKSMLTSTSTADAVFSIFGHTFLRGSSTQTSSQSFNNIRMDDTNLSITTQPDLTSFPTLLGVVATKGPNAPSTAAMIRQPHSNFPPNSISFLRQKAIQAAKGMAAEQLNTTPGKKPLLGQNLSGLANEHQETYQNGHTNGNTNGHINGQLTRSTSENPSPDNRAIEASMRTLMFPNYLSAGTVTSESKQIDLSTGHVIIQFHLLDGTTNPNGSPRMRVCPPNFVTACTVTLGGQLIRDALFNEADQSVRFFQGMPGTAPIQMTATTGAYGVQLLVALIFQL